MRKFPVPKVFIIIRCFPKSRKNSLNRILDDVILLESNGADGVFLVSEGSSADDILFYCKELKSLRIKCFEIGVDLETIDKIDHEKIISAFYEKQFDLIKINSSSNSLENLSKNNFSENLILSNTNSKFISQEDLNDDENEDLEEEKRKMYFYSDIISAHKIKMEDIIKARSDLQNNSRLMFFSNDLEKDKIFNCLNAGVTDFLIEDYFVDFLDQDSFTVFDFNLIKQTVQIIRDFK